MKWQPAYIQLPLAKMAGCPWNLLDARGMRIAWCMPGDHERLGEKVANDLLNLVAIGEAAGELLDVASKNLAKIEAEKAELLDALEKIVNWEHDPNGPFAWDLLDQARAAIAKAKGEVTA